MLDAPREVLAVERAAPAGERARVYVNVSARGARVAPEPGAAWADVEGRAELELAPWSSRWLLGRG